MSFFFKLIVFMNFEIRNIIVSKWFKKKIVLVKCKLYLGKVEKKHVKNYLILVSAHNLDMLHSISKAIFVDTIFYSSWKHFS